MSADSPDPRLATVVHLLEVDYKPMKIVINRGSEAGVKMGQRFLVYALSREPIFDPETQESLGHLEIVRGTGRVVHLQERIATLESDRTASRRGQTKTIRRQNPVLSGLFGSLSGPEEVIETVEPELAPFDEPQVGDRARPI